MDNQFINALKHITLYVSALCDTLFVLCFEYKWLNFINSSHRPSNYYVNNIHRSILIKVACNQCRSQRNPLFSLLLQSCQAGEGTSNYGDITKQKSLFFHSFTVLLHFIAFKVRSGSKFLNNISNRTKKDDQFWLILVWINALHCTNSYFSMSKSNTIIILLLLIPCGQICPIHPFPDALLIFVSQPDPNSFFELNNKFLFEIKIQIYERW